VATFHDEASILCRRDGGSATFFAPWDSRQKLEPIFGSEKAFFQDGDGGRRLIHTSHDPMPDNGLRQCFDPDASKN
jgi:hypothetical protein